MSKNKWIDNVEEWRIISLKNISKRMIGSYVYISCIVTY